MTARTATGLVLACALIAGCAPAAPPVDITKGEIAADLWETTISTTSGEVRAGRITFMVRNRGNTPHDFVVIRTELSPDDLPIDAEAQRAREEGRVGGVPEIAPGKNGNLRIDLQPGHYVVICNVPTHYKAGMRSELVVQ